jgi:hypothetical protein
MFFTWINFAISGHAISINQILEPLGELVGAIVSGRSFPRVHHVQNGRHGASAAFGSATEGELDSFHVGDGHPTFGDQTFLGHVQIEEIQRVVDGFDFTHFDEPVADVFGSGYQHAVAMVLRLAEDLHLKK